MKHRLKLYDWSTIPTTDQPLVKKQLLAYQRSLSLSETLADSQVLLSKGYDSAMMIASKPESEFVQTSGLELGKARMTYAKAQESAMVVSHHLEAMRDSVRGGFKDIFINNIDPRFFNDLREIDGFADLFGCQNYCDCEDCKSILSPSAYFVDLMFFIEQNISKPTFTENKLIKKNKLIKHPLYLKNRRRDLWKLNLTCENTYTLLPYLTIVNEVLETYLSVSIDIFDLLSSEKISVALPFNLPLEELRIYLSHFGIPLYEIYRILKRPAAQIWRARLNLSPEEFAVITTPDLNGVKFRFGNPATLDHFDVQDFIRLAGISREQLDELRAMTLNPDLQYIWIVNETKPEDLQPCYEQISNLSTSRLDFIHRWLRLWKKTAWRIPELDLVLTSLKDAKLITSDLNSEDILFFSQLVDLQEKLALTVEELCAIIYQLPVSKAFPQPPAKQADRRLYERLFDLKKIFGEKDSKTHEIETSVLFYHYSLNTRNPDGKEIDPNTPHLLGGLGISETELLLLFDLLKNEMPFGSDGQCTLDRQRISLLYRHAKIAKALKLSIADFIQALRLNFASANLVITTLAQIQQLYQFSNWLNSSPFTLAELCFVRWGEESATVKFKRDLQAVSALVQKVQTSAKTNKIDKVTALQAALAESFNLNSKQLTDTLQWVSTDTNSDSIQTALDTTFTHPADLEALLTLVREIERVLLVFGNLKFKEESTAYLTQKPAVVDITNLKSLTLDNLKALTFYQDLIALSDEAVPTIQTILENFSSDNTAKLADLWKQDKSLIESLTSSLSLPTAPIQALNDLWEGLNLCKTLGINGFSLKKLADDTDFAKLSAARDVVLGALSSKYDDETVRQEKLEPYQDKINLKKRDALCDYIIARQQDLKFKDLHDIYAFCLLDVEMDSCFRTSRLVCAISSLQLYVHRCLVNLEQSDPQLNPCIANIQVDPGQIPAEEWEWRKNYRVWEANRKVFLYPENYIEPDLRDNKTPIFKELEDELLQQKITQESTETAYKKYVVQFAELAHLRIVGNYYYEATQKATKEVTKTYYFFGRTQQDPSQYYYRKCMDNEGWIPQNNNSGDNKVWTPWEKIELGINAKNVSAVVHRGKLYIFWTEIKTKEKSEIVSGNSKFSYYEHSIDVLYSFLNENGKWISAQRLKLLPSYKECLWNGTEGLKDYFENTKVYNRLYPVVVGTDIFVNYLLAFAYMDKIIIDFDVPAKPPLHIHFEYYPDDKPSNYKYGRGQLGGQLDLFQNLINRSGYYLESLPQRSCLHLDRDSTGKAAFESLLDSGDIARQELKLFSSDHNSPYGKLLGKRITNQFDDRTYQADIDIVRNRQGEYLLKIGDQQYLAQYIDFHWGPVFYKRAALRVSTSLATELGEILFTEGVEAFLSLDTQKLPEHPVGINFTNPLELLPPYDHPDHFNFTGAYSEYYRELFFHIPFLIAAHLNANQKFKEAKWWYERIFDPAAHESPDDKNPTERNWRYIEFREVTLKKMKAILTDPAAIEQYKKDPFNPHAIARLRLSAYQKAIVMKYIDNLLDWGDTLFTQDTMESINEATMLYVQASDILGKRPAKLGKCETAQDQELTYENIGPRIDKDAEFWITVESWSQSNAIVATTDWIKTATMVSNPPSVSTKPSSTTNLRTTATSASTERMSTKPRYYVATYASAVEDKARYSKITKDWEAVGPIEKYPGFTLHTQPTPVFCIPPNYDLLTYWDRVEDRLFKIRHCMNISGVRRQLALFQPPIDPMMLVRAKAAGLSLEDILGMLDAPLPPYRFSYLVEKAKQFTQTVQSFGSTLLSALEKKDVEELTLLRSVHERNILKMTKDIKRQQVQEAQYQYQVIVETKKNVQNRIDYYQGLIDSGLTGWEVTQQVSKHMGTHFLNEETILKLTAAISYLVPQVGSPFAMKFGGKEIGDSNRAFSEIMASLSRISDAISASAGLEATFQRREQEWNQQLSLAQQELNQVEKQELAAEIRQQIAEKDLEIHEKNVEQADELQEFYKDKFTNLGLYNYLSTTLNRLYHEAYNMASGLAKMAEKTYQFERDDDTTFIASDNWQADRAGLLAGEQLLLQLQRMEKTYLENNTRDYEITQSFSLALLNPLALVSLKQTGNCTFEIDEIMFDLFYPGQYKRLIKSVRLSIPCVVGPYTNVSAKLTLSGSKVRKAATTNSNDLIVLNQQPASVSIATSNAQNDGGLFEFNFRDERYLPFEGAGAISAWKLELPSLLRPFDYDTISDVIIHLSYTAKDDGAFKQTVESKIVETLTTFASSTNGLHRLFSLRHEFPNAFHKLLNPTGEEQVTEFEVTRQHFPYFLADKELKISEITFYRQPKDKTPIETFTLVMNPKVDENPIKKWTLNAGENGLNQEELDDILILLKYKFKEP